MNGESLNIIQDNLDKLQTLFPDIFSEGKIDWEKLKSKFSDDINFANERYVLNWAGKADAFKVLQIPTTATLKPCLGEGINDFPELEKSGKSFNPINHGSDNVFIEGENLEVLKVLQKSYYGKIKCIIIDPPYNTGNDSFIYPDSFKENKADYEKRIGDKDEEGYLMKEGLFRKNSKDSGHYHSNWLSMMYPRLFLAKNLLKEDGVVFVHIDDNEVHNLRLLMNEIFGEENFVAQINIQTNPRGRQSEKFLATVHEYLLVFAKKIDLCSIEGASLTEEEMMDFKFEDSNGKYRLLGLRQRGSASRRVDRPLMYFPIFVNPKSNKVALEISEEFCIEVLPKKSTGEDGRWMWSSKKVFSDLSIIDAKLISHRNEYDIFIRDYLQRNGEERSRKINTIWNEKEVNNQNGTIELRNLFDNNKFFDFPKPIATIQKILSMIDVTDDDIILDFFAGSATTAQAVLESNKEDSGNRKFILVQLPELCDEASEAFKAGYKTIADISKERIRRVISRLNNDSPDSKITVIKNKEQQKLFAEEKNHENQTNPINHSSDNGFKVFKLSPSNFKIWRGNEITEENLVEQLDAFTNPVREESKNDNMLFELILKAGYLLTDKIEVKEKFYAVNNGELIIALEKMSEKVIGNIISAQPKKVITLDNLFTGNDQLKTNTVLQMKDAGIDFKTI